MSGGLRGVRSFLPNFLGKLPGGHDREFSKQFEDPTDKPWIKEAYHSPTLRVQTPEEFFRAIDRGLEYLEITHSQIEEARRIWRQDPVSAVKILHPVVAYLHQRGYNIVDLSGKHHLNYRPPIRQQVSA